MGARRPHRSPPNVRGDSIELKALPPSFFDISSEIDEHLANITLKISTLNGLYKKSLLPGFNDTNQASDAEIEQLNYVITKHLQQCYVLIKKFEFLQKNRHKLGYVDSEIKMLENLKKQYATKVQNISLQFRKMQSNYIKFLKDDEDSTPLLAGDVEDYLRQALVQLQIAVRNTNEQMMLQREREILRLATGVLEVSLIFRELENMVVEQGTVLDRIDYNLTLAVEELKEADSELIKGSQYQKRTQKCKIIFLLLLIVFALLIIVLVRPHGTTKIVHDKPNLDQKVEPETPSGEDPLLHVRE